EWLEHEARLEHHMTSETPHPYFQYVRAVLTEARRRMGQKLDKHDVLDFAFHTWAVHCATENPDRVTEGAINQCVDRHLQGLLTSISPQVVIAMGGPVARYFWWRRMRTWDGWGPMTTLHGRVLDIEVAHRTVPAILSVHPYQRGVDLHPDVIGRAIAERVRPQALQPTELKAACASNSRPMTRASFRRRKIATFASGCRRQSKATHSGPARCAPTAAVTRSDWPS